jgi:glycosyltransferase involved in cell wall biosynthesis
MVGSATKPEFYEEIKEEIAALRHPDKVILTVFRKDVEKVIAASDVIVNSSPWEPRSQVIHQSLIMKALVVASNKAKLIGGHYKRSNMAAIG